VSVCPYCGRLKASIDQMFDVQPSLALFCRASVSAATCYTEDCKRITIANALAQTDPSVTASVRAVVRWHVLRVLVANDWRMAKAARVLGVDRRTMYRICQRERIVREAPGTKEQR
jgi:transcriptional regulator with GAF, ATPase, and Fis domain